MSFAPLEDGLLFYTSGLLLCRFERILGFWVWFVALSCGHSRHCELKLGITFWGMMGEGCFSFGGTVQYIEESNIYLCFVVCRLKRGLVT